jgi:hypothetical protein
MGLGPFQASHTEITVKSKIVRLIEDAPYVQSITNYITAMRDRTSLVEFAGVGGTN